MVRTIARLLLLILPGAPTNFHGPFNGQEEQVVQQVLTRICRTVRVTALPETGRSISDWRIF